CKDTIPVSNKVVKGVYASTGSYKRYNIQVDGVNKTFTNSPSILSVNFYDNYDFRGMDEIPASGTEYNPETGYGTWYGTDYTDTNKYKNKGMLTGALTAQIKSDGTISSYLYSVMYYDNKKQLVQTKGNNQLAGGIEKEYIAYNFTGQPTQRKHVHQVTGKNTQTEVYAYTYDHAGRLLTTTHQLTDGTTVKPQVTLAENSYDDLGRLKTNKKGGVAGTLATYTYNVRSWTKSIAGSLFTENLYYNESYGGNVPRFNGNITAMNWTIQGETVPRGYAFAYDNLSRLTGANYLLNGSASATNDYKVENIIYDKHGNIKNLRRYGKTSSGATYALVDNLTMTYSGNQLIHAADAITNPAYSESADFKDKVSTTGTIEYTYTANGAMNKDLNKGISDIQYNSLNLPQVMIINSPTAKAKNYYTYSASGVKLRTEQRYDPNYTVTPSNATNPTNDGLADYKNTDYVGNIVYETVKSGSTITNRSRILVDGGYYEGGVYYYYVTDHLGNNRLVVNQSGTVTQKNHYYPFGTAFADKYDNGTNQPYKYNGKELDGMHQLNLYDYSARYYESALGRFTSVDPHAENYYSWSPYAYVGNNPINAVDPNGKDSYLLIWFSADGETGHAGIAIDNYKRQEIRDNKGNVVKDDKGNVQYEMVKDGTMTYYDLWPNNPVGKTELQKNVASDYSKGVKINSLSDLKSKDPTGTRSGSVSAEGRAADGIVQVKTSYEQDSKVLDYASNTSTSGKKYNACDFNCSTYAENALKQAFPSLSASQDIKVPFALRILYKDSKTVAPNNLYNATMKLPGATNIKGPKSVVAKPYLEYYGK
ncbi:RHS repeat-associated core domain-containing protein, partial [Dysgonomonas termitidis]